MTCSRVRYKMEMSKEADAETTVIIGSEGEFKAPDRVHCANQCRGAV